MSEAAERLGIPSAQARTFARSTQLSLPGMTLQLSLWQTSPAQQWVAFGLLSRPGGLPVEAWSELLLRSNCAISAMNTSSVSLNDSGDALLVLRLTSQPHHQREMLADELSDLLSIAESLVAGATALQGNKSGATAPVSTMPKQNERSAQQAQAAMNRQWHRPVLIAALQHLGVAVPPVEQIKTVGVIQANGRVYEVIADSDHQHLLVSTPLPTSLITATQRERALLANLHLMMLTQCAVVLAPHGSALQARWNSAGLDGQAFAEWLLDFGQLAESFRQTSAIGTSRNLAWTR
ncbi:CesT family type III secretion system chaperone [Pseudomonas sp. D1-1]|uniref:CesT family type III secretion system chaperone n=1 Tax=Pseudomonas sp. D1-1 TaxID=1040793 RepID=UPI003DA8AF4E